MGEDILNVAIMQYWVYSIKENDEVVLLDDGVSLHLNSTSYKKYLEEIYSEDLAMKWCQMNMKGHMVKLLWLEYLNH